MPHTINYTKPEVSGLSDLEEWSINQDKAIGFILKNGLSFKLTTAKFLERWATYTASQKAGFLFVVGDTMEHGESDNGIVIDSVIGALGS